MADEERFGGLRKGLLEFAILRIIERQSVYVADVMAKLSATAFATQEGTLYPLLSKLRREELLDYEWVESDQGPPRKYYRLTPKGAAHLQDLADYWRHLDATLENLGR